MSLWVTPKTEPLPTTHHPFIYNSDSWWGQILSPQCRSVRQIGALGSVITGTGAHLTWIMHEKWECRAVIWWLSSWLQSESKTVWSFNIHPDEQETEDSQTYEHLELLLRFNQHWAHTQSVYIIMRKCLSRCMKCTVISLDAGYHLQGNSALWWQT